MPNGRNPAHPHTHIFVNNGFVAAHRATNFTDSFICVVIAPCTLSMFTTVFRLPSTLHRAGNLAGRNCGICVYAAKAENSEAERNRNVPGKQWAAEWAKNAHKKLKIE